MLSLVALLPPDRLLVAHLNPYRLPPHQRLLRPPDTNRRPGGTVPAATTATCFDTAHLTVQRTRWKR